MSQKLCARGAGFCPTSIGGTEMERNMTRIALFAALIAALGLIPSLTLA